MRVREREREREVEDITQTSRPAPFYIAAIPPTCLTRVGLQLPSFPLRKLVSRAGGGALQKKKKNTARGKGVLTCAPGAARGRFPAGTTEGGEGNGTRRRREGGGPAFLKPCPFPCFALLLSPPPPLPLLHRDVFQSFGTPVLFRLSAAAPTEPPALLDPVALCRYLQPSVPNVGPERLRARSLLQPSDLAAGHPQTNP